MLKNEDFIQEFVDEARDHLENFEQALLTDPAELCADQINDAFRAVHSIKGTAGFFGLTRIVAIAHSMETILDFVNRKKIPFGDVEIDLLLEAKDRLKVLVNDVKQSETYPIDDLLEKLAIAEADISKQAAIEPVAVSEQTLPDKAKFDDWFDFDWQTQEKIAAYRKFGHYIYAINLPLTEQYLKNSGGLAAFIDNFTAVANVILITSPEGEPIGWDDLAADSSDDQLVRILSSSILEESLLQKVLGLPSSCITVLTENLDTPVVEPLRFLGSEPDLGALQGSDRCPPESSEISESLRVNIRLLDDLMNLASELVLGRNRLLTLLEPEKKRFRSSPRCCRILIGSPAVFRKKSCKPECSRSGACLTATRA